ncbi:FRG domain-containing protein [bacterium]|nr:FRG domain-containing protein [bacterium]
MNQFKEISIKDIFKFLVENEKDRIFAEKVMKERKQPKEHDPKNWRHDFFVDVISDMFIDGFCMNYPHGKIIKQTNSSFFYRGENQLYPTTLSSLNRRLNQINKIEERTIEEFIAKMRIADFRNLLLCFDHVQNHISKGLSVLYEQIAQHYGIETNWLDITSDLEVALFFACCKYSENKWMPLTEEDLKKSDQAKYGVLFRKKNNMLHDIELYCNHVKFFPIGYQPFMRCHKQYGYSFYMDPDTDLKDQKYFEVLIFKHNEEFCKSIYEKMEGGKKIFPEEGLNIINDYIESIKSRKIFSRETFNYVCEHEKDLDKNAIEEMIIKYNYEIDDDIAPNDISNEIITSVNEYYKDFDIEKEYNLKLTTRLCFYK